MLAAKPAGPPPTMSTSKGMDSRGSSRTDDENVLQLLLRTEVRRLDEEVAKSRNIFPKNYKRNANIDCLYLLLNEYLSRFSDYVLFLLFFDVCHSKERDAIADEGRRLTEIHQPKLTPVYNDALALSRLLLLFPKRKRGRKEYLSRVVMNSYVQLTWRNGDTRDLIS
jgi:hypothetical protein